MALCVITGVGIQRWLTRQLPGEEVKLILIAIHPPSPHIGPKSLILAPQDIPDISGYQLGFGRRFVKAYNTENPVTNQKIL